MHVLTWCLATVSTALLATSILCWGGRQALAAHPAAGLSRVLCSIPSQHWPHSRTGCSRTPPLPSCRALRITFGHLVARAAGASPLCLQNPSSPRCSLPSPWCQLTQGSALLWQFSSKQTWNSPSCLTHRWSFVSCDKTAIPRQSHYL